MRIYLSEEQAVLGSGLLYFISAVDIIPDYLFPIGYVDDAIRFLSSSSWNDYPESMILLHKSISPKIRNG